MSYAYLRSTYAIQTCKVIQVGLKLIIDQMTILRVRQFYMPFATIRCFFVVKFLLNRQRRVLILRRQRHLGDYD